MMPPPAKQAFSLVELSIVLVILGLLVGGVLTGQSLIRAAELRSVTTEYQKYAAAAHTFRDKYFALPGDMTNATSFWGSMTNCGAASPSGTGTQTCNGNGNGVMDNAGAGGQTGEVFGLWKQLANAGLIEGSFTGVAASGGGAHSVAGSNVPRSKVSKEGWSVFPHGNYTTGDAAMFAFNYGNTLLFGGETTNSVTELWILSPEEAWNIDAKIDDGKPGTGRLLARFWDSCTDAASNGSVTASDRTSAQYLYGDKSLLCSLIFAQFL